MAMRYRQLCDATRDTVGVYRSPISGRGLFCKRSVEAGQMVIEYAGQVREDGRVRRTGACGDGRKVGQSESIAGAELESADLVRLLKQSSSLSVCLLSV